MSKKHYKVRRGRSRNARGYVDTMKDRIERLNRAVSRGEWAKVARQIRAIESLSGKVAGNIEEANARVCGAVLVDEEMPEAAL